MNLTAAEARHRVEDIEAAYLTPDLALLDEPA